MGNNVITVIGKVTKGFEFAWDLYGEEFYKIEIETTRPSGTSDYLVLICSDRNILVDSDIEGKTVSAIGSIRTFNKKENDKAHVIVYIYVEELYVLDEDQEIIGEDICDLDGYLCKIGNLRMTPLGRSICDVILAVHREYKKSDYIPCVFWGKNAKYISELEVGTKVSISGRLQSRDYIKNNELRTVYEVSAQTFEVAE